MNSGQSATLPAVYTAKSSTTLVPSDPRIVALAKNQRMKPETMIAKIKECLPTVPEQQLFLAVAPDARIQPKTLAKILASHLGETGRRLEVVDFSVIKIADNIHYSRANTIISHVLDVLGILDKSGGDYQPLPSSAGDISFLVDTYGVDGAECVIDSIISNMEFIKDRMRIKDANQRKILSKIISHFRKRILPSLEKSGKVPILDVSVYFEYPEPFPRDDDDDY